MEAFVGARGSWFTKVGFAIVQSAMLAIDR
jgi:hypothetical protein